MSSNFHDNGDGEPRRCTTTPDKCQFSQHGTEEEIRQIAEDRFEAEMGASSTLTKKPSPSKSVLDHSERIKASENIDPSKELPTFHNDDGQVSVPVDDQKKLNGLVQNKNAKLIETENGQTVVYNPEMGAYTTVERYHSERFGKTVTVLGGTTAYTLKNGGGPKKPSTGATPEKLRKGRGDYKPEKVENIDQLKRIVGRYTFASVQKFPRRTEEEKKAIKDAGYPETTGLNPTTIDKSDRESPRSDRARSDSYVLSTGTRVNPHSAPENNEYIDSWNGEPGSAYEKNNHVLVVQNDESGAYRLIGTSGSIEENGSIPGNRLSMKNDQTRQEMGGGTVVGRFEPWSGGRAEGEIPNKSMPLSTFK